MGARGPKIGAYQNRGPRFAKLDGSKSSSTKGTGRNGDKKPSPSGYVPSGRAGSPIMPNPALLTSDFLDADLIDDGQGKPSKATADLRKVLAQAIAVELNNAKMMQDLIPRQEVERAIGAKYAEARDIWIRLEEMADELAILDDPVAIRLRIGAEVRRGLEKMAQAGKDLGVAVESSHAEER